jgi:hypothetical protein
VVVALLPLIIAGVIYAIWTPTLDEGRDIVVIVYGVVGATFFLTGLVVMAAIGVAIFGLVDKLRKALDESVVPALNSVKEAADTVRGTTEFVGRTAVAPVAKAYGTFAGVKKALSVLTAIKGRQKK